MVVRTILIKILKYINFLLDESIDRLMYMNEMRQWEAKKRKEGFPKEWFEEDWWKTKTSHFVMFMVGMI